jgi:acyl-coenzyme A synthetase/AMP-(fatty) acid ligase
VPLAIPPRFNLAGYCLGDAARDTPDKVALQVVGDMATSAHPESWTYGGLDRAVRGVAAGLLDDGFRPGDRLLLRLPNTSDYALLFFGAIAAGLVPIPVSAQLTEGEAAVLLEDSAAAAVVMASDSASSLGGVRVLGPAAIARLKSSPPLANYADTAAEDPGYMLYTSGTSGRPKGVVHTQRVVLGREPMRRDWQAIGAYDVMLHAGAFNWSYTLGVGLLDPWAVGGTAVLYVGPRDVAIWPTLIRSTGATLFAAVPSLYRQILKYCRLERTDFTGVRHCLAAGEAMSPAIHDAWVEATGRELYEALGMSECSTFVSSGPDVPVRPGSAGKPQQGRRIAILPLEGGTGLLPTGETGLLAIHRSDPGLMLGYWRRPDEDALTTRGEWFVGGDLAAFDDDGYLFHRGRADDTMNAGGYRVSPVEVEAALADCPGVAEVGVAERHVRPDVSIVAAYVVRGAESGITEGDVLAHAASRLAAYKQPKQVIFLDSLPRSANGKLLRRELG